MAMARLSSLLLLSAISTSPRMLLLDKKASASSMHDASVSASLRHGMRMVSSRRP